MKVKSLLLILAMACSLVANAYVPLVREGVKWVYFYYYDLGPDYDKEFKCEYSLEVNGDSVINGVTYKKVYSQWLKVSKDEDAPNYGSDKPELRALVRENDKVVYIHLVTEEDIWYYEELMDRYGCIAMVAGPAPDEWVLYDFNDINRTFSNLPTLDLYGFDDCLNNPEFTYSETIQLQGESAKKYVGSDFPAKYIIEGLGYVNMYDGDWLYTVADLFQPCLTGWPQWSYELSYLADADGNVLFKGPAYTRMCDNNNDGKVDGNDLNRLINFVLNGDNPWESYPYRYDANGDAAVDGADINEVINFILNN